MTNRLLTLALVGGAVGAVSAATVATAHQGKGKVGSARVQIATVASYSSGTLTVKTTDGSTVTGKVTRRTSIDCRPLLSATATPTPAASPEPTPASTTPDGSETRRGRGDDDQRGGRGPGRGGRNTWDGDGDDEDEAVCDTTSLTAGTGVIAASSDLTKTGQKFTRIVLVSASTDTSSSSDSDYVS